MLLLTTGNAGPSKEIQMLKLGPFTHNCNTNEIIVEEFNFGQPREKVIDRAVYKSLEMLTKEILKNVVNFLFHRFIFLSLP
jgi:nicotinamide-nucleotide amidase